MTSGEPSPFGREQLVTVLECIPTHRDPPISRQQLTHAIRETLGVEAAGAEAWSEAVLTFLRLFDLLDHDAGSIRLSGQIPRYFVESMKWYLRNEHPLMTNWNRPGTANMVACQSIPEMAPYFLRAVEERRIHLAAPESEKLTPSRIQPVTVLLIRSNLGNEPVFLHQWDARAKQYQMIGGRKRGHETPSQTAQRELKEEITEQQLVYGRDFSVQQITRDDHPIEWTAISRTYGALTKYRFWLFSVDFRVASLRLSDLDRWIPLDQMYEGETPDGKKVGDPEAMRRFSADLSGGLEGVPLAIELAQIHSWIDYVEMKPGWLGFSFNLKKFLADTRRKRKKS